MAERILYHSTNRNVNSGGIRGYKKKLAFKEALFMGMAPDNGLFTPTRIPKFSKKEILSLKGRSYPETAYAVLKKFLSGEIKDSGLKRIVKEIYNFDVPMERLDGQTWLVRLDRGPTASFKDFAALLMAKLMEHFKPKNKKATILVATSGDTGSAMGEAFRGLRGFSVYILYPKSEVSPTQKRHMDTIGKNVRALAVDGKFDDCQKLVKEAFSDKELKKLNLSSANSINIGRVLPQIAYYFYAYANLAENMQRVVFSIPSGNFGNSLGCEIARRMGLPVGKIIIAVNGNDEFPEFLRTGKYKKLSPSRKCLSNAMNVGNPSNLARYFELYNGTVDKDGNVHKKPDLNRMRKNIHSVSVTDKDTVRAIRELYRKKGIIVEPHGAVAVCALEKYRKANKKKLSVCMETADPAKFPEIMKKELKINPKMPQSMKKWGRRKGKPRKISRKYRHFKEYLLKQSRL